MATLCLQEEEMLAEKVEGFPVLYDKRVKDFLKEKERCCSKSLGESS